MVDDQVQPTRCRYRRAAATSSPSGSSWSSTFTVVANARGSARRIGAYSTSASDAGADSIQRSDNAPQRWPPPTGGDERVAGLLSGSELTAQPWIDRDDGRVEQLRHLVGRTCVGGGEDLTAMDLPPAPERVDRGAGTGQAQAGVTRDVLHPRTKVVGSRRT